ncbi:S-locus glycoprotein domain-containing protein [Artemisia annua]|uniref:S-locus glycoprotein domain-containing protein n=1 Tax=Artemisia annua TaxID=35608 RepID=A0A2U1PTC0_ARTAN|nr:S-locus glycoprotein domain-containing protein [Artemisia annua]
MIFANTNTVIFSCILCIVFICFQYCSCKDNITIGESIDGTKYLESAGKKFQMGFFTRPKGSERRYIGIWYAMDPQTVVWVANRNQPLLDSSVVLIREGGEVKLRDKDNKIYFNFNTGGGRQTVLKLLDSGNAVLQDTSSEYILWQSFSYPTDTFLPGMKMDSGLNLTSWKSVNDPSPGSYVFQKWENVDQYVILYTENLTPRWKSGFGSMKIFEPNQVYIDVYNLLTNSTQTKYKNNCTVKTRTANNSFSFQCKDALNTTNYVAFNNHSRLIIDYAGSVKYFSWVQSQYPDWEEPENECSVYGVCGKFALCYVNNQITCNCLDRFQRVDPGDASSGCKLTSDIGRHDDVFINVSMIKVENPSIFFELENRTDCETKCLQNPQCKAYSYSPANKELAKSGRPEGKNRCWMWDTELMNLQTNGAHNICVRVSAAKGDLNATKESSPENSSSILRQTHVLILTMTILVILLLSSLGYIYYKRLVTREQGNYQQPLVTY